jgi:hypothetical protein
VLNYLLLLFLARKGRKSFFSLTLCVYPLCRLAGFFNEQPQMMALATSPSARSPAPGLDIELAHQRAAISSGGGGDDGRHLAPLSLDAALAASSGRSEGLSSPVLRENKALQGIGTLGAALEAELTRVAAWRQAKWGATRKGWTASEGSGAVATVREDNREPLIMGNSDRIEEKSNSLTHR